VTRIIVKGRPLAITTAMSADEIKSLARHGTPKTATGLTDSSHSSSSSSSAERYRLDEFDTAPILLYKYRGGLCTTSQKDLCAALDKDEHLRCTRKPVPRYCSYLDIKRHDMYLPEEKEQYASFPNYDASLAAVKIPMTAYLSRIFMGTYDNLYIVSPENAQNSSSPTDSMKSSTASL